MIVSENCKVEIIPPDGTVVTFTGAKVEQHSTVVRNPEDDGYEHIVYVTVSVAGKGDSQVPGALPFPSGP